MRVIAKRTLREFWEKHPDSEGALKAWYHEAVCASWSSSAEVKAQYRSASIVNRERVVFNVCGNKYRLVVRINYGYGVVYVRFIGTHDSYDKINVETV